MKIQNASVPIHVVNVLFEEEGTNFSVPCFKYISISQVLWAHYVLIILLWDCFITTDPYGVSTFLLREMQATLRFFMKYLPHLTRVTSHIMSYIGVIPHV